MYRLFFRGLHRIASEWSKTPPYYLLRKYIFGYAVVDMNGSKMYLDLKNDDGISKELLVLGKREGVTVDHLLSSNLLKHGGIALDIGANIGYYALIESQLVGDTGKVYAVEPVLNNFNNLKRNVELNDAHNIETFRLAIGDTEKEVLINVRSKGNLSSFTEATDDIRAEIIGQEKVKLMTADSFSRDVIGTTPSFVRMDVEGYEAAILEGMTEVMKAKTVLLIEFHPLFLSPEQKERMCALLRNHYSHSVITINPKADVGPFLRFLNTHMGIESKRPQLNKAGSIELVHEYLYSSKRVFNAFIYE